MSLREIAVLFATSVTGRQGRLGPLLAYPAALAALLAAGLAPGPATAESIPAVPPISLVGEEQIVFDYRRDGCPAAADEPRDIPDIPAAAFRRSDGQVVLLYGNRRNHYLVGSDLDAVARVDCGSLLDPGGNEDPAQFADREWLMGVHALPDGGLAGFVHQEYHGDSHAMEGCAGREQALFRCWYGAATLQLSSDGGFSFKRQALPRGLLAALPYRFSSAIDRAGLNSPKVVFNRHDGYLYVMLTSAADLGAQERGQCLLRGRSSDAAEWRAWSGEAFDRRLESPYAPDFVFDTCRPVLKLNVWSIKYLERQGHFLAIGQRGKQVAYAVSSNLTDWSEIQPLEGITLDPPQARATASTPSTLYYSLLDPASSSPWFDSLAASPYLYFVRWRSDPDGSRPPGRDVVRVAIRIGTPP